MYKLIPYIIVPLGLWAYLYFKTRKEATPGIKKIINTLGSTLLIIGLSTYILDWFRIGTTPKMIIIMLAAAAWAVYFNFFWNKKKSTETK